jgi:hypothetical protein
MSVQAISQISGLVKDITFESAVCTQRKWFKFFHTHSKRVLTLAVVLGRYTLVYMYSLPDYFYSVGYKKMSSILADQ